MSGPIDAKFINNEPKIDLVEAILKDIGGTFKKFQIFNYVLFCLPFALSGSFGLSYVFTALNIQYRCLIPECEVLETTQYEPAWLSNAVPFENGNPSNCLRYMSSVESYRSTDTCDISFNQSIQMRCSEYIYKTNEVSIVNNLHFECDDVSWKLAMVGTANNLGRFIFMPIMSYLSDRFGRRTILISGVFGSSIFGYLRSFSPNYMTFVLFEFLDAGVGSVTYSASFILAMEWVGIKDRILIGSLVTATYPFGQVFLGFTARAFKDYRRLLQIIYAPGFLILFYYWIAAESIRWLIVNNKKDRLFSTIKRAERMNGQKLSQNTIDRINNEIGENAMAMSVDEQHRESKLYQFRKIFMKWTLLSRFLICCFLWLTNAFISYGISLTSVSLPGDKYVNFVVIAIAGIPAMLFVYFLMETFGRRWTISMSLLIGGLSIIGSKLMPTNYYVLAIVLFFIGKCFITVSFTGLYVYTSELWPTNIRHSVMGFCSTVGRIGAALAPMAPLLSYYSDILPYVVFSLMAVIASILVLELPETLKQKLPDTLSEAEQIGRKQDDEAL